MRSFPSDKYDHKELARLNAEPWMVDLLKRNPEYVYWGPHEDYMTGKGQWTEAVFKDSWAEFDWQLDELNECVNFYFSVVRESTPCLACDESGYNPATHAISEDFYAFDKPRGEGWADKITEDEVAALAAANRLHHFKREDGRLPTAAEVNAAQAGAGFNSHDAINRHILIEARAKRLGVYGKCQDCEGHGYVYTEPAAHVSLTLWMLHPRKGCSRGVEIKRVEEADLLAVYKWLRTAAARNADRFAHIPR